MSRIEVECAEIDGGWLASATVTDRGTSRGFEVAVSAADLDRFAPGSDDPCALVRRSFEFLLAREPKESILLTFNLAVIGQYYPEFETEIRDAGR